MTEGSNDFALIVRGGDKYFLNSLTSVRVFTRMVSDNP